MFFRTGAGLFGLRRGVGSNCWLWDSLDGVLVWVFEREDELSVFRFDFFLRGFVF